MIFYKYIFKETAKTQLVILLILLTVFMCQSLIRLIGRAAVGSLPVEFIGTLAFYALPQVAVIMLPLTLFLAVLLTLGRICSDSEMVVLRSVGFSPVNVMGVTMALACITAAITGYVGIVLQPEAARAQEELTENAKNNPQFLPIESGRFVSLGERFTVYIDEVGGSEEEKTVSQIYVMDTPFARDQGSITTAQRGYLQDDDDGVRWLYLFDGKRYEGSVQAGSFRRVNFSEFKAPVTTAEERRESELSIDTLATSELLTSDNRQHQVEAQWRISSIFAVFVLTLVAVPLSMVNPRQGRFAKLMPALLIYAAYYMFLLSLRNLINHGQLPVYPGMYLVPLLFALLVGIPLNLPKRYVRRFLRPENKAQPAQGKIAGTDAPADAKRKED